MSRKPKGTYCPHCNFTDESQQLVRCPMCGAAIELGDESAAASSTDRVRRERELQMLRSPRVSGTFYLLVAVVFAAILLVGAGVASLWIIPIVIVGAVVVLLVVGAMQLRQDQQLSEKGFLPLMGDVLKHLPVVVQAVSSRSEDQG